MLQSAHSLQVLVVLIFVVVVFYVLAEHMLMDGPRVISFAAPLSAAAVVILLNRQIFTRFMTNVMAFITGVNDSEPSQHKSKHHKGSVHIHISPEAWKYIGFTLAACVAVTLLVLGVLKYRAWHNSPVQVEARALKDNEVLRRIQKGFADNPDIQTLTIASSKLASLKTPEAAKLRLEVDEELQRLRGEEERAALANIAEDLEDIKFRNDPAELETSVE
jgi:hypothetical protein